MFSYFNNSSKELMYTKEHMQHTPITEPKIANNPVKKKNKNKN